MSTNSRDDFNRREELHVANLLFGLSPDEQAEYETLKADAPEGEDDRLDLAVASLDVAWLDSQADPLPDDLRKAIRARAEQELASSPVASSAIASRREVPSSRAFDLLPWLVSVACLALAMFAWFSNRPVEKTTPSLAQLRSDLLSSDVDHVEVDLSAGTTPIEGAKGDLVWSSALQEGYMHFNGLPVNNPTQEQYQLWIFDKNQSEKTPIDGGVFNITSSEDDIVPIHAKLHVEEPLMFAVTIEKPGGVVVSSRERLPLIGKVN